MLRMLAIPGLIFACPIFCVQPTSKPIPTNASPTTTVPKPISNVGLSSAARSISGEPRPPRRLGNASPTLVPLHLRLWPISRPIFNNVFVSHLAPIQMCAYLGTKSASSLIPGLVDLCSLGLLKALLILLVSKPSPSRPIWSGSLSLSSSALK